MFYCSDLLHFVHSSSHLSTLYWCGDTGSVGGFTVDVQDAVWDHDGNLRVADVSHELHMCNISIPDYSGCIIQVRNVTTEINDAEVSFSFYEDSSFIR